MPSENHEKEIQNIAETLSQAGFKVVILNKTIPDLLVSRTDIIPIEYQKQTISLKIKKLEETEQFKQILVITGHVEINKRKEAFLMAKELKEKSYTNKDIQLILKTQLDVNVTSRTISDWVSGRCKTVKKSISNNNPKTK